MSAEENTQQDTTEHLEYVHNETLKRIFMKPLIEYLTYLSEYTSYVRNIENLKKIEIVDEPIILYNVDDKKYKGKYIKIDISLDTKDNSYIDLPKEILDNLVSYVQQGIAVVSEYIFNNLILEEVSKQFLMQVYFKVDQNLNILPIYINNVLGEIYRLENEIKLQTDKIFDIEIDEKYNENIDLIKENIKELKTQLKTIKNQINEKKEIENAKTINSFLLNQKVFCMKQSIVVEKDLPDHIKNSLDNIKDKIEDCLDDKPE